MRGPRGALNPMRACWVLGLLCFCRTGRDRSWLKLGWNLSLFVCCSFIEPLTFSIRFYFPFSCRLLFPFSPPTGAVCIPARRGGGVCDPGLDKNQASAPNRHAARPPPPPWENGCTLLPGRALVPLWMCCQPWQQRLNMICLSAAACLHHAPSANPHYSCVEIQSLGMTLDWGSWKQRVEVKRVLRRLKLGRWPIRREIWVEITFDPQPGILNVLRHCRESTWTWHILRSNSKTQAGITR